MPLEKECSCRKVRYTFWASVSSPVKCRELYLAPWTGVGYVLQCMQGCGTMLPPLTDGAGQVILSFILVTQTTSHICTHLLAPSVKGKKECEPRESPRSSAQVTSGGFCALEELTISLSLLLSFYICLAPLTLLQAVSLLL